MSSEHLGVVRVLSDAQGRRGAAARDRDRATGGDIEADLLVWAAGVKAPEFLGGLGLRNQAAIASWSSGPTLQTTRDDRILAIGDCCSFTPAGQERPVPPRAQAAHQMAATTFANLKRLMAREAAQGVHLPRPRLAGVAQPVLHGGEPDGQPDRRTHGGRRPAGAVSSTPRFIGCTWWRSTAGSRAWR